MNITAKVHILFAAMGLFVCPPVIVAQTLPTPAEPLPSAPTSQAPLEVTTPEVVVTPIVGRAPPGAENINVTLSGIALDGVTVYREETLRTYYQDLLGNDIPLTQVFEVAEAIEQRYRDDGYPLVQVIVPAQRVRDGRFIMRVVEGFVGDIRLDAPVGSVRARMQAFLDRVKDERPVMSATLERALLLVNDLPGVSARGVLRPGTGEVGGAELVVSAQRKPLDVLLTMNNRGSRFTGPTRGALVVRENSALSVGEELELMVSSTLNDEQRFGRIGYSQFVGDDGLQADAAISYGQSSPGGVLSALDAQTRSTFAGVGLSYPIIRSRKKNLFIEGGIERVQTDVELLDSRESRDRLWVLRAGAALDTFESSGARIAVSGGLRQGLSVFDASERGDAQLSRTDGDPEFSAVYFEASRLARDGQWGLLLATKMQYSFSKLLSSEEFRLGGEAFGRGYEPSELAGEHGVGLTAEAQFYGTSQPAYQVYAFYDLGSVWNEDPGASGRASLASAGIGLRTNLTRNVAAEFELAKPLTRSVGSRNDDGVRAFFQVTARF